jgi:cytochrome c biogenesis protein CcmG, thiol:disulfide interchange protein DsbE
MAADGPKPTMLARALRMLGILTAAGFVALLVYGVTAKSPDRTIDDALASNRAVAAPGFALSVLSDGRPGPLQAAWQRAARDGRVDLAELRGTPVVLNFWASWCDPCREEANILQHGWETGRGRGVLFLGLNMQDVREDARNFLRELRQDFPNVRDPTKETSLRWGATGIPETFFISSKGEVVGHVIGVVTARQLNDGMHAAIAGRPGGGAQRGGDVRPTR